MYAKYDAEGNFQKWGITQEPAKRYTNAELAGGRLKRLRKGPRTEMLKRERRLVERFPGPQNKEPWAGIKAPKK